MKGALLGLVLEPLLAAARQAQEWDLCKEALSIGSSSIHYLHRLLL
jgi:hypothetical protein